MEHLDVKYYKVFWSILFTLLLASYNKCEDGDVRLVGSPKSYEGRVEVENDGIWGSVCSNGWDHNEAEVVCRQLGFSNGAMLASSAGLTTPMSEFGPVFLTNLMCNGGEERLTDCSGYSLQGNVSCNQSTEAVVVCQVPSYQGCFQEETPNWVGRNILRSGGMTLSFCISTCRVYDFTYARLGNGETCHCGNSAGFGSRRADKDCNIVCTGNINQICGGNSNIYSYFSTSLGASSGTFEDSLGTIASPNFPGDYSAGDEGEWRIVLNSVSPVNFTFDYIDLYIDDYIEIIPVPNGEKVVIISSMESQLFYQLTSGVFNVRFVVSENTPPLRHYGFLLRYQAPMMLPPTTTERNRVRTTTTSQTDDSCPSIGELFEGNKENIMGSMLFYKDTVKCSGSLTMVRVNCEIEQSFHLTLWRQDGSGNISPVKSIMIDKNATTKDSDGFCTLQFGSDEQSTFLTREGDRLSLDFSSFPFLYKDEASSSDIAFVMMDQTSVNGFSVSDLEKKLSAGNAIAVSLEISFRKRDECRHEFRHTNLMSNFSSILDGDSVDIVCDQYYHTNVSSTICLQGGQFENQEHISCDRTCPENFGTTENLEDATLMQNVSDEIILNTGQPLSCRGSIVSVSYYARPSASFTLSTWSLGENGGYVLFNSYRVEGKSPGGSNPSVMQRNLTRELKFLEGYILGISYSADNPIGFTTNSSSGGDFSTYLVWSAAGNEITEGRRLVISDATEQQRVVSLKLTLKAANRCFLDIPNSENVTSPDDPDVQGYIPDGFVQEGDKIQLICSNGYTGNGELFTCEEMGSFDHMPECRIIVRNTTSIWVLLIMGFVVLGVGLFGVFCLVCYWLCTIPEPRRKIEQVEEYILNRRDSEEFPDSLPGDGEDGEFFNEADGNAFEATAELNDYQGYPPAGQQNPVPPPYDPHTDTFDNTLPAPRAVTFADESDNDLQADDDRTSPIPIIQPDHSSPEEEEERPSSPLSGEVPPSVHVSPASVEYIPPSSPEIPPPPPEIPPPPPEEPPPPPAIGEGDDVPLVPLPPPPSEEELMNPEVWYDSMSRYRIPTTKL